MPAQMISADSVDLSSAHLMVITVIIEKLNYLLLLIFIFTGRLEAHEQTQREIQHEKIKTNNKKITKEHSANA